MKLDDLRDLDPNNPGAWPGWVRAAAIALVFILAVLGGWYFGWSDKLSQLERAEAREPDLLRELDQKKHRAANLDAYRRQKEQIETELVEMLGRLPGDVAQPSLVEDISLQASGAGLEIASYNTRSPTQREFYAELPVDMRVIGTYEQLGQFVSGVANMDRIVTLHNLTIEPRDGSDRLGMNMTARTYWYLDPED
ncbi:type 4a pilus biogenesis protein PilO [Alkalilimnicola ehrlichii MLHE-1]|uniref:Pilus assembly protein, PilO n=1 Tax=Alkalilimnicola ehrlichii (strain ATCC BAA-1101 / DSM 17681 / MLHE-1) TaxID=187272 RepID=Q0A4Z0_ALKEH|nr:type 4a pilus biogenesis protein PilO [Alkalilimnicola ehrlichii]ABI58097.1 Pilus assembly protein, PilO [Alkalilimnicola ehrlichii MLHE-1]